MLTLSQYASKYNINIHTLRSWVKKGQIEGAALENNRWKLPDEPINNTNKSINKTDEPINNPINNSNEDVNNPINNPTLELLIIEKDERITSLDKQVQHLQEQLFRQENRVDELIKQNDQSQHIIGQMEKDRQKLIESHRSPFTKLLGFLGVGNGVKST